MQSAYRFLFTLFAIGILAGACGLADEEMSFELAESEQAIASHYTSFMVRTINLDKTEGRPYYPSRMERTAQVVRNAWSGVGLIGLQEGKRSMRGCRGRRLRRRGVNAGRCFAQLLTDKFGRRVRSAFYQTDYPFWRDPDGGGAAVWGSQFRLLSRNRINLGPGVECRGWGCMNYDRYLIEAKLRHRLTGKIVRFYVTHLYPGGARFRQGVRHTQTHELVARIRSRVRAGELPPILVGDFNYREGEPAFDAVEQHFYRPAQVIKDGCGHADISIDKIYIGRKSSFPQTCGGYLIGPQQTLRLTQDRVSGVPASDHNSTGNLLYVSANSSPADGTLGPWACHRW